GRGHARRAVAVAGGAAAAAGPAGGGVFGGGTRKVSKDRMGGRAWIFGVVLLAAVPRLPAQTTAFVGVTVVPMDRERVIERQTVLVRDGRIAGIGPAGAMRVPLGATRVDGRGKYLIPGLADMHVHFGDNEADNRVLLTLYLANGVTTVLNLHGSPAHLALRDA